MQQFHQSCKVWNLMGTRCISKSLASHASCHCLALGVLQLWNHSQIILFADTIKVSVMQKPRIRPGCTTRQGCLQLLTHLINMCSMRIPENSISYNTALLWRQSVPKNASLLLLNPSFSCRKPWSLNYSLL